MAVQTNQVFFPSNYADLFSAWERFPHALPYAGGTGLVREQGSAILDLPSVILSLEKIEEMHRVSRSERYLEIGAMVKLSRITDLGKIVPRAFRYCLFNIAGPQLRNMATLGGNICFPHRRLDCPAVLTALDAQYEIRNAQTTRWVAASRFFAPGSTALGPRELLTRIRIPLEDWDYSVYKKFSGQPGWNRTVVFLARIQKSILSDIRVVFKAGSIVRDRNSESILAGKQLPLSRRIADEFVEQWEYFLQNNQSVEEMFRQEILNFIEMNVYNLSD